MPAAPEVRRTISLAILVSVFTILLAACESPEEKFHGHMQRAESEFSNGQLELASVEVRNALRLDDNDPDAHYLRARVAEAQQQFSVMQRHLERTVTLAPDNVDALIRLAWLYTARGNLERAASTADRALRLAPDEPRALVAMANIRLREGEATAAQDLADTALQKDPVHADAFAVLAAVEQERGNLARVPEILRNGMNANPDNLSLAILLLEYSRSQETISQTKLLLQALIGRMPSRLEFSLELADYLTAEGRSDEAEAVLQRAVSSNPDNPRATLSLIELIGKVDASRAISILEDFQPGTAEDTRLIDLRLADLQLYRGDIDIAIRLYQKIADEKDDELAIAAHRQLARIAAEQSDLSNAENHLSEALGVDPAHEGALLDLALLQQRKGEMSAAMTTAQRIGSSHPESVEGTLLLGRLYEDRQSKVLARSQYQRALTLDAGNAEASLHLAQLRLAEGEPKQAERLLATAHARHPDNEQVTMQLVDTRIAIGDWTGAAGLLTGSLSNRVSIQARHYLDGQVQRAAGDLAASSRAFADSLAADPEYGAAITALIENSRLAEDSRLERALLEDLISRTPNVQRPYVALAAMHSDAGDADTAIRLLNNLMDKHPNWLPGEQARTRVFLSAGETVNAKASARRVLAIEANDRGARLTIAQIESSQGKFDEAIAQYEAILESNPEDIVARNNLASILIRTRLDTESIQRAASLSEGFRGESAAPLLHTLGWIDLVQGRHTEGVNLLRKAAYQLPDNEEVRCHLALGKHLSEGQPTANSIENLCRALAADDVNLERLLNQTASTTTRIPAQSAAG